MSATINNMDFKLVDILMVDQLEVDDFIGVNQEIVQVVNVTSAGDTWVITFLDEYGEKDFVEVNDDAKFDLYVLVD